MKTVASQDVIFDESDFSPSLAFSEDLSDESSATKMVDTELPIVIEEEVSGHQSTELNLSNEEDSPAGTLELLLTEENSADPMMMPVTDVLDESENGQELDKQSSKLRG